MSENQNWKDLLGEWRAPEVPPNLAARLDRARLPLWRRMLTASIPVPVPVAVGIVVLLGAGILRLSQAPSCAAWFTTPGAPLLSQSLAAPANCPGGQAC
jgi:hypothetical protein